MRDYYIYYDGNYVRGTNATLPVLSASSQFGLNVFEGIRVYKEEYFYIFRLKDHLNRLNKSLSKINFDIEIITENTFIKILKKLIELNNINTDFSIRFTYLINEIDSWSSNKLPVFFIAPLVNKRNSAETYKTIFLTETRRINSLAMDTKVKCGANYINSRYAMLEAKLNGADFPILKSKDGYISESSGSCVFIVKKGVVITPSLDCDILESITRDTVIKILKYNSSPIKEMKFTEEEFKKSEEIFICGTAAEITPVKFCNTSDFKIGKITKFIFDEYRLAVTGRKYNEFFWAKKIDMNKKN